MTNDLNNKDFHFKGQYADEELVGFFRKHWITLIPDFIIHGIFVAAGILAWIFFPGQIVLMMSNIWGAIVITIAILVLSYGIHHFFIKLINHFLHTVIITNFRIVEIDKIMFVKDSHMSLDMKMIQDIEKAQKGFWKNALRYVELMIMMSSADVRIIKYVPNPDYHFRLINRLKAQTIQRDTHIKTPPREHQTILHENLTFPEARVAEQES